MATTSDSSPAQAREDVITEADLDVIERIAKRAWERFPLVHEQLLRDTRPQARYWDCRPASDFTELTLAEDGTVAFVGRDSDGDSYESMLDRNFLLGTDDEFNACLADKVAQRDMRWAEEAHAAKQRVEESDARVAAAAQAERDRIFHEECAARGIDPIPPTDIVARRRRMTDEQFHAKGDADADEGLRLWILYGDMSKLDEPFYTAVNEWEKREGLQG